MRQIYTVLPRETADELQRLAREWRCSRSDLIRQLIVEALQARDAQALLTRHKGTPNERQKRSDCGDL